MSDLATYLYEHRKAQELSMRKLAELANISHTEIKRLESGERKLPSPPILKALANALGVSYDEIMHAAGYMDSAPPVPVIAARLDDTEDLTVEEMRELRNYINYIRSKRESQV